MQNPLTEPWRDIFVVCDIVSTNMNVKVTILLAVFYITCMQNIHPPNIFVSIKISFEVSFRFHFLNLTTDCRPLGQAEHSKTYKKWLLGQLIRTICQSFNACANNILTHWGSWNDNYLRQGQGLKVIKICSPIMVAYPYFHIFMKWIKHVWTFFVYSVLNKSLTDTKGYINIEYCFNKKGMGYMIKVTFTVVRWLSAEPIKMNCI